MHNACIGSAKVSCEVNGCRRRYTKSTTWGVKGNRRSDFSEIYGINLWKRLGKPEKAKKGREK